MAKSIFKNLSYNVLLQIVLLILPMISLPYVSRVLGAEGIGAYSYTLSITQYFIILGTIGLALYGNRQIAYVRDDVHKMSTTFWSIFILRVATTSVALIVYYIVFAVVENYRLLQIIQSVHIVAAMIDISWLYVGMEDFKRIVTRNLIVKLGGLAMIFWLIKKPEDLTLYTLINVGMSFGSSLIMWVYVPKILVKVKVEKEHIFEHLKPAIQLFIPQIASQVYVLLDKTMIGLLSTIEQVGFYSQAERIVKAVLELVTALGTVMLPRMSNIFARGDHSKMRSYFNTSLAAVSFIAIPMCVGIASVSFEFVPWFFGPGYEQVINIMIVLSPILIFIALSSVMGIQYLLPTNRVHEFTISIVSGAVVNVILNSLLIPQFQAIGAAIGTIAAEFSVMAFQAYFLRDTIDIKRYLSALTKYVIASILMFGTVRFIGMNYGPRISTTLIQAGAGVVIYFVTLTILKDETNQRLIGIITTQFGKLKSIFVSK